MDAEGIERINCKIWIPDEERVAKLKKLVNAHCGFGGHRGRKALESRVRTSFLWSDLETDVVEFVQSYIHCIVSRTGDRVPRPSSTALHGQRPNEVAIWILCTWGSPTQKT